MEEDKTMNTLLLWLRLWTDETCITCQEAIKQLETLQKIDNSDNFEGFLLTVRKTTGVPTIHISKYKG